MRAANEQWAVIGRGLNGWHAISSDGKISSSGGRLENYTYWTGQKCDGYLAAAAEGALLYDAEHLKRTPAEDDFARLVLSGPMVDPGLGPEGVRRFGEQERKAAARMLPGLEGGFQAIAEAALAEPPAEPEKYGSLDNVGTAVYERLLRKIPGLRIGRARGGVAVWES